jgi:quinol monooxygenase YgiN
MRDNPGPMVTKIYTYAKFAIHDGKAEEFKSLARECSEIVNRDEPGTLFYEWFLNPGETECVAIDCYADIDAMLEHIKHIGPLMRRLMTLSDRYLEIYGADPSPTLAGKSTARASEFYGQRFLGKL